MATMNTKTTYVHPVTREVVSLLGVDTLRGQFIYEYQQTKFHPTETKVEEFDTRGVQG